MTGAVCYHEEENELGIFSVIGATENNVLGYLITRNSVALATARWLRLSGWIWIGEL